MIVSESIRAMALLLLGLALAGCHVEQTGRVLPAVVEEGRGFPGFCELGQRVAEVTQSIGSMNVRYIDKERKAPWLVYESNARGLSLDVEGKGRHAKIRRITILLPSPSLLSTRRGLVFHAGEVPTTNELVRVYGTPEIDFGTNMNANLVAIVDAIKTGKSYSVSSPDSSAHFWHYPAHGIAFYLHGGQALRCYLDPPFDRPVWTF